MEKIFCNIGETMKITGLSRDMLYRGAKSGLYPHIMAGKKFLFNMPQLLDVLNSQSAVSESRGEV